MKSSSAKKSALRSLARKRQKAAWEGYKNIGDYYDGAYECLHVSPYTKSADNLDSPIMVFLQDWTSDDSIRRGFHADSVTHGQAPELPTNRNLVALLKEHFDLALGDVYATNLFPFIKPGHMGKSIPRRDLLRAAQEFGLPQIEIIKPRLVICLGKATFNAIREAAGFEGMPDVGSAIAKPFNLGKARIWCQAHTGGQGQAMRNAGKRRVPGDWSRMRKEFQKAA